ncbi:hypothetical protein [Gemmatimonas groenlandica]|uniref:DUF4352 domain-containing protein n=1 Tax=Gemmatimonas groenlandica TaxID=2732249 RepID=A0A6M4IPQ4_9BACT|nr:hypothetical protein [Gemmatimonas groenlandica]QJR35938.1 hypothetical protein HKW67_10685 [Gemmatimonas groenlandica]
MRHQLFTAAAFVAIAAALPLSAQSAGCAGQASCYETTNLTAVVSDLRSSVSGANRVITATIRIQNRTPRPLTLGYLSGSGVVTDDQGNRYEVASPESVRGIGLITSNSFDAKFQLQPGERADARVEFLFRPASRNVILGTTYAMDIALREINPIAGNQWRLGREHALRFTGFDGKGVTAQMATGNAAAATAATSSTPSSTAMAGAAQVAMADEINVCAGVERCYASGPVRVDIVQMSAGDIGNGRYHGVRLNVRVRNMSNEPIIIGYKGTSSGAIDNLGNRYYFGRPGTHDVSASGIGVVTGQAADPQFALRPGESRNATFNVTRFDAGRAERGTSFTWNATLVQLEITPSRQIRTGREFAVQVADVTPSAGDAVKAAGSDAANKAAKGILDALSGKKKKPPVR